MRLSFYSDKYIICVSVCGMIASGQLALDDGSELTFLAGSSSNVSLPPGAKEKLDQALDWVKKAKEACCSASFLFLVLRELAHLLEFQKGHPRCYSRIGRLGSAKVDARCKLPVGQQQRL